MDRDVKIGKITKESMIEQKVEILTALRSLGEQVTLFHFHHDGLVYVPFSSPHLL